MSSPQATLKKLGLSDSEISLYLALVAGGAMSASELTKAARAKRPTVYYAIRQLLDRGLVHKSGSPGVERFQAENPNQLLTLLALRQQELKSLTEEVRAILPSLAKPQSMKEGLPAVSFYEGEAAMKRAIMETNYCRSGRLDFLTPHDNFFWQVGQAFSAEYIRERQSRRLVTRHLWEQPLDRDTVRRSYPRPSEIRLLPAAMKGRFRTTVIIYDDQVLYVASRKSGYALLVKSHEHHELMKAIFDQLWAVSPALPAA